MKLVFTKPYDLYRYDLEKPHDFWNQEYHNKEYIYPEAPDEMRFKNQIGAYFFYNDRSQAQLTGETGARKFGQSELWLTHTRIIPNLTLLDLRKHYSFLGSLIQHTNPLQIINRLYEIGINVLNDAFYKYEDIYGKRTSFSDIRPIYQNIINIENNENGSFEDDLKKLSLANEFNNFFNNRIGYLGQLLTDFSNGSTFKQLLISNGFNGYIFEEEIFFHKPTFCIFDSSHLENPTVEKIVLTPN